MPDRPQVPVTPANWQTPPVLGWAFQHVDELFPAATIDRGAEVAALPAAPRLLDDLAVDLGDGTSRTVADIVATTDTDAWLVLHDGAVVAEEYRGGMTPSTRHLLMSVSKSLVSGVVGALVGQGLVDPAEQVTAYVPELATSGYAGATVRDLLDMRSGILFSEDYLDADAHVRLLDEAVGWAPQRPGSPPTLKAFLPTLERARPHGGPFEYRSCETDVLGWICEAAAGEHFPGLASRLLWARLGAEHDAYISVDTEGTGMFDGGICATLRDLARFGAMVLDDGVSLTGEQVVPRSWLDDVFTGAPDSAEAFAATARDMPGGMYRSQFWFPSARRDLAVCLGIHGQMVVVDRATRTVGVKLSSWPDPLDDTKSRPALRMFEAIGRHLAA